MAEHVEAEHVEVVVEHVEGSARDGGREAPGQVGKGTPRLGNICGVDMSGPV